MDRKNHSLPSPEEIEFDFHGMRIAAKLWGPNEGIPVLATHGWLDNAGSYDCLAPLLNNLRIVAIDFSGHGLSSHIPPGGTHHYIDYITEMVIVANAMGWEKFALMGHSMGAGLSSILAGTFPERISHLILLDFIGPLTTKAEETPEILARSVREQTTFQNKESSIYSSRYDAVTVRQKTGKISRQAAEILATRGLKRVVGGFSWRTDPRLRITSPFRMVEEQALSFLKNISAPTCLVLGKDSEVYQRILDSQRCESVPYLKRHDVKGGHHVHLENAALVVPVILEFFQQNSK